MALKVLPRNALEVPDDWFWTEWLLERWLEQPSSLYAPLLVFVFLSLLWTTGWEAISARTPGARLLSLTLVNRRGLAPGLGACGLRLVGSALNVATFGLGYFWIVASRYRRGWHDIISDTYVIHDSKKP